MEKRVRSLIKSISWRILSTFATMLLVLLFTGNIFISSGVGLTEVTVKTVIYYLHERIWSTSNFGIEKPTANKGEQEK